MALEIEMVDVNQAPLLSNQEPEEPDEPEVNEEREVEQAHTRSGFRFTGNLRCKQSFPTHCSN